MADDTTITTVKSGTTRGIKWRITYHLETASLRGYVYLPSPDLNRIDWRTERPLELDDGNGWIGFHTARHGDIWPVAELDAANLPITQSIRQLRGISEARARLNPDATFWTLEHMQFAVHSLVDQIANVTDALQPPPITDRIDQLVNEQLKAALAPTIPIYPPCPNPACETDWHALPLTVNMLRMQLLGAIDPDYRHDTDTSTVICAGSREYLTHDNQPDPDTAAALTAKVVAETAQHRCSSIRADFVKAEHSYMDAENRRYRTTRRRIILSLITGFISAAVIIWISHRYPPTPLIQVMTIAVASSIGTCFASLRINTHRNDFQNQLSQAKIHHLENSQYPLS